MLKTGLECTKFFICHHNTAYQYAIEDLPTKSA